MIVFDRSRRDEDIAAVAPTTELDPMAWEQTPPPVPDKELDFSEPKVVAAGGKRAASRWPAGRRLALRASGLRTRRSTAYSKSQRNGLWHGNTSVMLDFSDRSFLNGSTTGGAGGLSG